MNAEQYRALVNKLEAIQEAEVPDPNAVPAQSSMNVASNNVPQPAAATDPNQIPTIEAATFNQAYAQAVKQGLRKFKWCGVYAVKSKPRPVNAQPAPDRATSDFGVKPAGSGYDVDPNAPGVTNYSGMGVPGA